MQSTRQISVFHLQSIYLVLHTRAFAKGIFIGNDICVLVCVCVSER